MPDMDPTYEDQLVELIRSIEQSRADVARHGPVSPDDLRRSCDDAIERGLRRRASNDGDRAHRPVDRR